MVLNYDTFSLDIRKKIFTTIGKHCHKLPKDMMDPSFLETFKVEKALSNLIQMKMFLLTAGLWIR